MPKTCTDYRAGNCTWGRKCKFAHPEGMFGIDRHMGGGGGGGRTHPYQKGNNRQDRHSNDGGDGGGHGPVRRNHRQQQPQPQHGSAHHPKPSRQQQQPKSHNPGATPLSPGESYPMPPSSAEDGAQQQQHQHQQQEQQQPAQQQQQQPRPQQQQGTGALHRARAMCKLLCIGNAAPLVSAEMEASAVKFFSTGAFFRETPFADSIERFLPALKQQ